MEPKQKQYPVVDVTGDRNKVQCYKETILQGNLECYFHETRQIGTGQTGDGKSECRHSRNLRTDGLEWVNLTQMTIISTTAGRNPSEEME